jgi:acyl carrier protein
MQVEEEWDIVLSDDDVEKLVGAGTVKDVLDYVMAKVK